MAGLRPWGTPGLALALTMTMIVVAHDDRPTPLLEALAYVAVEAQPAGLESVDWAQLRERRPASPMRGSPALG